MKLASANVDSMQVFVIIKKRWNDNKWRFECEELLENMIKDLFLIQVIVNVNVINHVLLENI